MSKFYNHLSLDERRKIYYWREEKISVNEIAKRLGRHRSTVFRELQRNPTTKRTMTPAMTWQCKTANFYDMDVLDQKLETERLILRILRVDDIQEVEKMNADPEVMELSGSGRPLDKAETFKHCCTGLGHWMLKGYGMYVLEHKETGDFCGSVGLRYLEDYPCPELSWILPKSKWGNGYAIESARAVKENAFQKLGFEELFHFIDPKNVRSIRLVERLGATPVKK